MGAKVNKKSRTAKRYGNFYFGCMSACFTSGRTLNQHIASTISAMLKRLWLQL